MSTATTAFSSKLATSLVAAETTPRRQKGVRGLAAVLMAAMVAGMVVLADRLIDTWADEHLFLGWVALWAVIFAAMALFADAARGVARRVVRGLDGWSRTLAEARADARLWDMAQNDPRLMNELVAARQRERGDFDVALAPLGIEPVAAKPVTSGWAGYIERLAEARAQQFSLYYI
ncbi:MAG: hypothetical protein R3E99_09495 [Burkholderiaceae bacterium]